MRNLTMTIPIWAFLAGEDQLTRFEKRNEAIMKTTAPKMRSAHESKARSARFEPFIMIPRTIDM